MVLMERKLFLRVTMSKSLSLTFREFRKNSRPCKASAQLYQDTILPYCNIPVTKSYFTPLVKNFPYPVFRFRCKDF